MLQILARYEKGRSLINRLRFLPTELADQNKPVDIQTLSRFHLSFFAWSFFLCVILPAFGSALYFAFIASDEYVSEAHFTVRTASENNSSIVGDAIAKLSTSIGIGGVGQSTTQDVFIVADYIRSRSIIEDMGGKQTLFQIYSRPNADWLSRLNPSSSLEKVWKYWNRKISAIIDTPSGIILLEVRAFTPEDAHHIADLILTKSEALINDISERSRRDALIRAEGEVRLGEDRLRKARAELLEFRNNTKLIDPMLNAKSISETIGKLTQNRILLENNRAVLGNALASGSPVERVLTDQINALNEQIANLKNQLTSQNQNTTISSQISGYENLQLEVQFAEKLYSIAQSGYERARVEQEKQQLYLVTIDKPSTADKALYPRIFLDSTAIFAACFILWSMVTLMAASVRDHMGG
jgi:capsular polysaccharide transport system permease protein